MPMQGKCLTPTVVYKAEVKPINEKNAKVYIGLTELPFKKRYYLAVVQKYMYSTELIWELKKEKNLF